MITAEWTMRNLFFSRWGFPFELAAGLYEQLGRREEARDTARLALKQPWWTVDDLDKCVCPHGPTRATPSSCYVPYMLLGLSCSTATS